MELLHYFIDLFLHLDTHLTELLARFDTWIYVIVFLVIFAETGLVITPFLPGDSLLFALGALAAVDTTGTLSPLWLAILLCIAAILGDATNYSIGRATGSRAFSGRYRFIKVEYLHRTEKWFARYGALTIVVARFAPIVRTFAPFVAGIGRMQYRQFFFYNVIGAIAWVLICVLAGFFLGELPIVKENFELVILAIIFISVLPIIIEMTKGWLDKRKKAAAPAAE